jgi:hypothetical protein
MATFTVKELTGSVNVFGVERSFEFSGSTLSISGIVPGEVERLLAALPCENKTATVIVAPSEPSAVDFLAKKNGSNGHVEVERDKPTVKVTVETSENLKPAPTENIQKTDIVPLAVLENAKGLRDVVSILLDQTKNPDELVKICKDFRDRVPALKTVDLSNMDTRVRRIASVLIGEVQA